MSLFSFLPTQIQTPHVPLGVKLEEGLAILQSTENPVIEDVASEHYFKVDTSDFRMAIYPKDGQVGSVWYDDPTGRRTENGKKRKIELYLMRYGALSNWELRSDNGWMRYWFNPHDQAAMVYGIHKDVIRFNQYRGEHA